MASLMPWEAAGLSMALILDVPWLISHDQWSQILWEQQDCGVGMLDLLESFYS